MMAVARVGPDPLMDEAERQLMTRRREACRV